MPKVTINKKVIDEVSGMDKSTLFKKRVEEMREKSNKKEIEKKRRWGQFYKEKAETVVKSMVDDRRRYDSEWMTRDLFRRGYQFSNYNSSSRTIAIASRSSVKVPINLTWAQMRSIRNQVTSFRPKWETLPTGKSQEAMTNARYSGRLLDYYYDRLGLRHMVKETVTQGLVYSVGGPWQVGYDPHADNGNGEVFIWLLDPYDFFIDSSATCIEDAEFCCKAVRHPLDEVRNNPEFEFFDDTLSGESRMAVSEYKQFLLQTLKQTQTGKAEEEEGVIQYEVYIKERVNEVNKEKLAEELRENKQDASKLRIGEVLMRNVFYVDSLMDPLKVQLLRRSDFPFVAYHADINPKEFYGESWIKHMIPVNRLLNALESSVFEYNYRYGKGRFVLDKNSGVKLISNRHGDFIEVNPGHTVTSVALSPLPASYAQQISNCWRYLEDIGGSHDISLGRIPAGVKSGIGIAELKSADACVDTDTEALTKRGWKRYNEILDGEDIYVLDPETKKGKWGKVNWIYFDDKENTDMYKFKTRNFDCIATPDHSWLVKNRHDNWSRKETAQLKIGNNIPLALPSSSIPTKKTYIDDFVELAGWTITEGTYYLHKTVRDRGATDIKVYQSEINQNYVEEIRDLFKRLGITRKPYRSEREGMTAQWAFVFANEEARLMRKTFPTKSLTVDFVSKLTKSQLELLLDTLIKGDGHTRIKDGRRSFINTNKETIDSLQALCSLLGIATTIGVKRREKKCHSKCYVLYLKKTDFITAEKLKRYGQMTPIKFTGRVWCPNTDAGYWLARRNGVVFYTGNTNQADLVDNLEDFMVNVGKKVLNEIANNYSVPKLVKDLGKGGKVGHFAVIGEETGKKRKKQDTVTIGIDTLPLAIIGKDSEVRVTIGSWLAYTKSAREEKLKELAAAGILDQRSVLEHLEFSDIDNIVQRTREEGVLSKQRSQSPTGEEGVSEEEIARAENEMMLAGKEVPVEITDNHNVHRIVHQEALGLMGNPVVERHISEHEQLLKAGPQSSVRDLMSQSAPAPSTAGMPGEQGAPPQGALPQGALPGGVPPGMEGELPQDSQASPEQQALQDSLAGMMGG